MGFVGILAVHAELYVDEGLLHCTKVTLCFLYQFGARFCDVCRRNLARPANFVMGFGQDSLLTLTNTSSLVHILVCSLPKKQSNTICNV